MRVWLVVLIVIAACAGLVYIGSLNSLNIAVIDLYLTRFDDVPLWAALAVSTLLGAGLSALVVSLPMMRLKLRLRRSKKRISQLEQEVHALRTVPLDETTKTRVNTG